MDRNHSRPVRIRSLAAVLVLAAVAASTMLAAGPEEESPLLPVQKRAFVTSTTYTGAFGGLAAADALCQARASAAGLGNPGGFVAFLSDGATDAFCHVQGLTGKRIGWCGQGTLPTNAGPWIRLDGVPFAARIDLALAPTRRLYTPLLLDEYGAPVPSNWHPWTGTKGTGELDTLWTTCTNWTVTSSDYAGIGESWATGQTWVESGARQCLDTGPLLCVETGAGVPLPPYRSGGALAFVASTAHDGNFGGLAGADTFCQGLATAAGLPGASTFLAWLSDDATNAIDRFTYDGPWIRVDGVRFANGKSDLTDGTLRTALNVDETGAYQDNLGVWTGTTPAGLYCGYGCSNWGSASGSEVGWIGRANRASGYWTDVMPWNCDNTLAVIYCLADFAAILFVDDFESSDTFAWTLTTP